MRATEVKALKPHGYEELKSSRWCLLKTPENLTSKQGAKLKELLKVNLRSVRAYLLKEEFRYFWEYSSPVWADKFLNAWTTKVMRSRIEPMKRMARQIRLHQPLILNWFRAKKLFSSGIVEGFNNKAKVTLKKPTDFALSMPCKSPYFTNLEFYRRLRLPTLSGDEPKKLTSASPKQSSVGFSLKTFAFFLFIFSSLPFHPSRDLKRRLFFAPPAEIPVVALQIHQQESTWRLLPLPAGELSRHHD